MSRSREFASARDRRAPMTLLHVLAPHWHALVVGLMAVGAETAAALLEPWPVKIVLDGVAHSRRGPAWLSHAVVAVFGSSVIAILQFAALGVVVIAIVGAAGAYVEKQTITGVGQRVLHELRSALYWHAQRLSMAYHDNKRTGEVISTLTTDIDAVQSAVTAGVLDALYDALTLVGMVAIMFILDWRFTLVAVSVLPVLVVIVYTFTRRIKRASREVRKKEADIVSTAQEVLSSMRLVKAFGREEYEQQRFETESAQSVELALRARTIKAQLAPMVEIIVACGAAAVLWFGAREVLRGALTIGVLVVFLLYLGRMYKPIRDLSKLSDTYSRAIVGWDRLKEFLGIELQVQDLPGARSAPPVKGAIELEHVTFAYEPGPPALDDVCLTIEPGQRVALVGPTGSGKSTLISLIARFYDPQRGSVKIDGVDIRQVQRKSLREQMSFVLQDTLLFRAPVWQNIAYGKCGATRADVVRAAKLANADDFIRQLPRGYDTMIGERGVTLSAGQQQRVAIARAIIRNAPVLILDEPSSRLDAASEVLVLGALRELMRGKTAIIIAHRLTTIENADAIFVLDRGRIRERGTHTELIRAGGLYTRLFELQSQSERREEVALAVYPV